MYNVNVVQKSTRETIEQSQYNSSFLSLVEGFLKINDIIDECIVTVSSKKTVIVIDKRKKKEFDKLSTLEAAHYIVNLAKELEV
uniref:Uncharacterized protein n=1 Tax=viral metagenome TaxID=1070528 RepID=A0A6M3LSM3_9ZZZZ